MLGTDRLIPVELEGNAYQVRDRVRQFFRQLGTLLRSGWPRETNRARQQKKTKSSTHGREIGAADVDPGITLWCSAPRRSARFRGYSLRGACQDGLMRYRLHDDGCLGDRTRLRDAAKPQDAMGPARSRNGDRGANRRVQAALLACSLVIGVATSEAQSPGKQVLLLQSLDRGNLIIDRFTGEFRVRLDERNGKPVNVVQMVLGPTGSVGAREQATVDYVRSMYADRPPPDLIVTTGGPAAVFARKYRQQLFPGTPLLLGAVDQRYLGDAPLGENESAVAVAIDYPGLIDDILRVLPETRHVFMVIGSGTIGRFWRRELGARFSRFRNRVTFAWSDEMSLPDILNHVASLPTHSVIFYLVFGTDALGGAYADEQVLADLHTRANSPVFAGHSPYFGLGVVGGSMMNVEGLGLRTAEVANRILNGEPPASLRPPPQVRDRPVYDWRELRRWGIPESWLPPGSVV